MSYRESITRDLRASFLKYTRVAFSFLPKVSKPSILELGCGSGTVTAELARLSDGHIHAIDIDDALVDQAADRIEKEHLADRVTVERMDLLQNAFPDGYFDIIWEEGTMQVIGFKQSFEACRRILSDHGHLVLGQAINNMSHQLDVMRQCGFRLMQQLSWPEGCWWTEYYAPLQQRINQIKETRGDPHQVGDIGAIEAEIRVVAANPSDSDCAHYILVKDAIR